MLSIDKLTLDDFFKLNGKDIFICSDDIDFIYNIDIIDEIFDDGVDSELVRYASVATTPLTNDGRGCYTVNCRERPMANELYCYFCLKKKDGYIDKTEAYIE